MVWRDTFIAVDWGTTNRRAWRIGGHEGVADHFADDLGLIAVPPGGFVAAVADIRQRLGPWPMLMAGMVGSDRGWQPAPYVTCPATAAMLAAMILWIEGGETGIVPGLCQRGDAPGITPGAWPARLPDVMRGEELQAIGAVASGLAAPDAYLCHPGTHCKWVRMADGGVARFQTMMTGELFNLLRGGSIIGAQMQGDVADDAAFAAGVEDALAGTALNAALFSVRARHLLQDQPRDGASYVSGLLIGGDVQAGLAGARPGEEIAIVGRADLADLYATAMAMAGYRGRRLDADQAFLAGMAAIAAHIEKDDTP